MSVEVMDVVGGELAVALTPAERTLLAAIAERLCDAVPEEINTPEWIAQARRLSAELPVRLRQSLRRFTWNSGRDGMLLLRNLPVEPDTLPATPSRPGSVQVTSTVPAAALVLIAMCMGEAIAFEKEKAGALVQDVVPVPGMEDYQGNAGSTRLNMHTENAFHEFRPDLVGLMCLRNDHDNVAGLRVASVRNALPLLSGRTRALLHEPRFVTAAPASFGDASGMQEPHGILSGDQADPDFKVDFSSTIPADDEAAAAMAELERAVDATLVTLILTPGDLAFVDNRVALHGRNSFHPRYDGADRWLQRVFVQLNFRQSRALRPGDGQVICDSSSTA